MVEAGDSADHAQAMYDESVTTVVIAAVVVAAVASVVLAVVLARMLARPLAEVGEAARRIADGDYAARVPRDGPEELASLADSFNQMAASLERQETMRRDFIANAAHELRTPLTNLQGYLEALRDGVITADRATYESLWDEAERLVRLSRSLDALAEGDAADDAARARRARPVAAIRTALDLAQPTLDRAQLLHGRVDVPGAPAGPGQPGSPRPGARQPHLERRALHARRAGPSRSAPSAGRRTCWSRSRTPATASRPRTRSRLRAVLSGREVARPRSRRRRHRAGHRQAAGRGRRRPGRRRIARRTDALLVQPAGLTASRDRDRDHAGRTPASPNHWMGRSRSPRNATAMRIVTAGPNDDASPTIQVGADLEPVREGDQPERRRGRRRP